jgi:hypothetical protein
MRDEDKPFVMYRRGPWNFTIVPRGTAGWLQFGLWLAVFAVPTAGFALYAEAHEGRPEMRIALGLYLVATLVWTIALVLYTKARAEVVDVAAMLRQKREAERGRRKH